MELGTKGPLLSECTACAASNMAIGDGLDAIRLGRADVMICGGTEAPVSRVGIAGFGAMRAISRRNDDPKARLATLRRRARRVRDGRGGRDDRARGARARQGARGEDLCRAARLRRLVGRDARLRPRSRPARALPAPCAMAFEDAGIEPDEVGYVNAHGTSTPVGDSAETRVIKLALGEEKAYQTPVSSTKGATGHCLGAAGAVEASSRSSRSSAASCRRRSTRRSPTPTCDLDYIPNEARERAGRDRRLELVRLRRAQRLRRLPAVGLGLNATLAPLAQSRGGDGRVGVPGFSLCCSPTARRNGSRSRDHECRRPSTCRRGHDLSGGLDHEDAYGDRCAPPRPSWLARPRRTRRGATSESRLARRAPSLRRSRCATSSRIAEASSATGSTTSAGATTRLSRFVATFARLPQLTPLRAVWSYNNAGFCRRRPRPRGGRRRSYDARRSRSRSGPTRLFFPWEVMTRRLRVGHVTERQPRTNR